MRPYPRWPLFNRSVLAAFDRSLTRVIWPVNRSYEIVSGRDGHRTKTGKTRVVPMSDALHAALMEHLAAYRFSGSPWVFFHLTTRRRAKALSRLGGLLHAFQNAAKRAQLPNGVRPYDLRHRQTHEVGGPAPDRSRAEGRGTRLHPHHDGLRAPGGRRPVGAGRITEDQA